MKRLLFLLIPVLLCGCEKPNDIRISQGWLAADAVHIEMAPEYKFYQFSRTEGPDGPVITIEYRRR